MRIAFSNDHAAVAEKGFLVNKLRELGHEIVDYGARTTESVDYPDYIAPAAEALMRGNVDRAVIICGSGVGSSIVANRFPNVRCALVTDLYAAEMCRRHNDANCLALRSREQDEKLNARIIEVWLATPFEGGRHATRVRKIEEVSSRVLNSTRLGGEEK